MSISACECRVVDSRDQPTLLSADRALDVLAEAVWRAKAPAFDGVYATVYRAAEDPRFLVGYSREFGREELTSRWGPRPAALDTAAPVRDSLWPWMLLPLGWLVYIAVMVALVGALRSGRVIMVWLR